MTSVRENQGESGNFKIRFQIRESQGKSTFLGKIREKSGNFIINQGKISGNFVIVFISYFYEFPRNISLAPSALGYLLNKAMVYNNNQFELSQKQS